MTLLGGIQRNFLIGFGSAAVLANGFQRTLSLGPGFIRRIMGTITKRLKF